jgi:glycosyltransferase involved in cell wall biosynthesis
MTAKPLVSIVIPFLDPGAFLREAVESVLAQTYAEWELILVDDGSSDGSSEVAAEFANSDRRIRAAAHPGRVNRGMSVSRNLGIEQARGEYLAFLDADDLWPPDKLEWQVAVLHRHRAAAAVFGAVEIFDEHHSRLVVPEVEHDVELDRRKLFPATLIARTPLLTTMGNPLLRHTAVEAVGGFEDTFRGLGEDAVVWCKLALRFPFLASDQLALRYRRHAGSSGAQDAAAGSLYSGQAALAKWLATHVEATPASLRREVNGVVDEFLFRSLVLDAWTGRDRAFERRRALAAFWLGLRNTSPQLLTGRRRARLLAMLALGWRADAIHRLQEPHLSGAVK